METVLVIWNKRPLQKKKYVHLPAGNKNIGIFCCHWEACSGSVPKPFLWLCNMPQHTSYAINCKEINNIYASLELGHIMTRTATNYYTLFHYQSSCRLTVWIYHCLDVSISYLTSKRSENSEIAHHTFRDLFCSTTGSKPKIFTLL